MTVIKASEKFFIPKNTIYKLCRDSQKGPIKYINAIKKKSWEIDDSTTVIMTKEQIQFSLLQILKYKNNPNVVVSCKTFPERDVYLVFDYLCCLGFVSKRNCNSISLEDCLSNVKLTEEGIDLLTSVFDEQKIKTININFQNTNNIGFVF